MRNRYAMGCGRLRFGRFASRARASIAVAVASLRAATLTLIVSKLRLLAASPVLPVRKAIASLSIRFKHSPSLSLLKLFSKHRTRKRTQAVEMADLLQ